MKFLSLRLWPILVAGQVGLSLVLLTTCLLLIRSVRAEVGQDPGFDARRVLLMELDLPLAGYTVEASRRLQRELVAQVAAVPGVEAASVAGSPPVDRGWLWGRWPAAEEGSGDVFPVQRNAVGAGYLSVLGVELVAGRAFTEGDDGGAPRVAIVNEAMAARLGGGAVLGRSITFRLIGGPTSPMEIVGVARDVRVDRRRRELGIRMALGSGPGRLRWEVVRDHSRPVAVGVAAGAAASVGAARLLGSALHGVGPADPVALAVGSALLLAIAAFAISISTRRTAAVDPAIVLRSE